MEKYSIVCTFLTKESSTTCFLFSISVVDIINDNIKIIKEYKIPDEDKKHHFDRKLMHEFEFRLNRLWAGKTFKPYKEDINYIGIYKKTFKIINKKFEDNVVGVFCGIENI